MREWTKKKKLKCLAILRKGVIDYRDNSRYAGFLCNIARQADLISDNHWHLFKEVFPELYTLGLKRKVLEAGAFWREKDATTRLKLLTDVRKIVNEL